MRDLEEIGGIEVSLFYSALWRIYQQHGSVMEGIENQNEKLDRSIQVAIKEWKCNSSDGLDIENPEEGYFEENEKEWQWIKDRVEELYNSDRELLRLEFLFGIKP